MRKKYNGRSSNSDFVRFLVLGFAVIFTGTLTVILGFSLATLTKAQSDWYLPSQKQGTFDFTNATPTPTQADLPTQPPGITITVTPPPQEDSPPPATKQYCVDEEPGSVTVESCDDATRCDIAHGAGGPSGTCGTVIGWEHTIIELLLGSTGKYNNKLSDNLSSAIQS